MPSSSASLRGRKGSFSRGAAGIGKTRMWREGSSVPGPGASASSPAVRAEPKSSWRSQGSPTSSRPSSTKCAAELPPPQRRALAIALLLEDAEGIARRSRGRSRVPRRAQGGGCVRAGPGRRRRRPVARRRVVRTLEFALRRLEDEPVGVLGTVRALTEVRASRAHRLAAARGVTRLPLAPLRVGASS